MFIYPPASNPSSDKNLQINFTSPFLNPDILQNAEERRKLRKLKQQQMIETSGMTFELASSHNVIESPGPGEHMEGQALLLDFDDDDAR